MTKSPPYVRTPYAQFLADNIHDIVMAPNAFGWKYENGNFRVAGAKNSSGPVDWTQAGIQGEGLQIDESAPGQMIQFTPKK